MRSTPPVPSTPRAQRVHPSFFTLKEIVGVPKLVKSDHLMFCATLPLFRDDVADINLLSLNVMGIEAGNNLTHFKEDKTAGIERYKGLAADITNAAAVKNIDIIHLQEVTSEHMAKILADQLGAEWEMIPSLREVEESRPQLQLLTFYKKSRLEHRASQVADRSISSTFVVRDVANPPVIQGHNAWLRYDVFPDAVEEQINELWDDRNEGEHVYVIGDLNSRLAPIDDKEPRNLTTGVVPPGFNGNPEYLNGKPEEQVNRNIQIPDHPDGGFYVDPRDDSIHQLKIKILGFETGQEVVDKATFDDITKLMTNDERAIWHLPRAVLCLDDHYKTEQIVGGETIFDYEKDLQATFQDSEILVRMASTIFNERYLCIRFKPLSINSNEARMSELLGYILPASKPMVLNSDRTARPSPCIFVPEKDIPTLVTAIDFISHSNLITALATQIRGLELEQLAACAKEIIAGASNSYSAIPTAGKFIATMDFFGIYKSIKGKKTESRATAARENNASESEALLALLKDETTGQGLKSYRYALASTLLNVEADSDENAGHLIEIVRAELDRKLPAPQPAQEQEKKTSALTKS